MDVGLYVSVGQLNDMRYLNARKPATRTTPGYIGSYVDVVLQFKDAGCGSWMPTKWTRS